MKSHISPNLNVFLSAKHLKKFMRRAWSNCKNIYQAARKIAGLTQERAAVLTLVDAVYDFADDRLDRELIDIARDGVILEDERERFDRVVDKIRAITAAALALTAIGREG